MLGATRTRVERSLARYDEGDTDLVVTLLALLGGGSLLVAFVAFLLNTTWTAVPLVGFLLVAGYGWVVRQAWTVKALTFVMTGVTMGILGLIAVFVFLEALPAARVMSARVFGVEIPGLRMFTRTADPMWQSTRDIYSLLGMMWGTLASTILATLVAAPLGIAGALFISEIAPDWARELVKPGVEILAGIPSIVYGFIGFTIINTYTSRHLGTGFGSIFAVGLVIGLMALPTVVSVAEDAISSVPESMKSGALAMGTTEWQTMKSVTLPTALSGVTAAVLLGVGRAVGETMAATVMLGHSQNLPAPLYDVFFNGETLTGVIASQYGTAVQGVHMSALFAAGVVLFVSVTLLSIASQVVEWQMQRTLEGQR